MLVSHPAVAEPRKSAKATPAETDDAKARALKHFERARELYRDGNYKDAITELESARDLDPDAKDLVYNLALVSEKLGRIDDALRWMRKYSEMDLDAQERGRAESAIRRLEGAKRTLAEQKQNEVATTREPNPSEPKKTPMGRIDALTITAGSVAVVGLGLGVAFGIQALSSRPKSGFVTGQNGSYADLADQSSSAHSKAVVADVGFGLFIAGGAACALLYFLRPKADPAAPQTGSAATTALQDWSPRVVPLTGGVALGFSRAMP